MLLAQKTVCALLAPGAKDPNDPALRICADIFEPAIEQAGLAPLGVLPSEGRAAVLAPPVALLDLSGGDCFAFWALGLRQAAGLPSVLVREQGAAPSFAFAGERAEFYRKGRVYDQVLEDRARIAAALKKAAEEYALLEREPAAPKAEPGEFSIERLAGDIDEIKRALRAEPPAPGGEAERLLGRFSALYNELCRGGEADSLRYQMRATLSEISRALGKLAKTEYELLASSARLRASYELALASYNSLWGEAKEQ